MGDEPLASGMCGDCHASDKWVHQPSPDLHAGALGRDTDTESRGALTRPSPGRRGFARTRRAVASSGWIASIEG